MENENILPPPNEPDAPSNLFDEPIRSVPKFNILLLIAGLMILTGFFLPWIKFRYPGIDFDMYDDMGAGIPTINGIYLLTSVNSEISELSWLLTIFLVFIPLGSGIVAFNSAIRGVLTKATVYGIAASVFLPLCLFTLYLFIPRYAFGFGGSGRMIRLGIGFILMVTGSGVCFIYAMIKMIEGVKNVNMIPSLKYNIIGGAVTAGITYLVFDNIKEPDEAIIYLYIAIFAVGLLVAGFLYRNNTVNTNYYSSNIAGFIFSLVFSIVLLIIIGIAKGFGETMATEGFVFLIVTQSLFGFIITSLSPGSATNKMITLELEGEPGTDTNTGRS